MRKTGEMEQMIKMIFWNGVAPYDDRDGRCAGGVNDKACADQDDLFASLTPSVIDGLLFRGMLMQIKGCRQAAFGSKGIISVKCDPFSGERGGKQA